MYLCFVSRIFFKGYEKDIADGANQRVIKALFFSSTHPRVTQKKFHGETLSDLSPGHNRPRFICVYTVLYILVLCGVYIFGCHDQYCFMCCGDMSIGLSLMLQTPPPPQVLHLSL